MGQGSAPDPSLSAQCISPGLVETQFAFRLHDKDPEKAAATYEHIKVGPPSGLGGATRGEGRRKGTLAFRPHPSLQPVNLPGGLGWECGCWRGPQWWEGACIHSVLISTPLPRCSQCLKPEDVAEAVLYVLSTPPHVQVSLALAVHPMEKPNHPQGRRAGKPEGAGQCALAASSLCTFCRLETSR